MLHLFVITHVARLLIPRSIAIIRLLSLTVLLVVLRVSIYVKIILYDNPLNEGIILNCLMFLFEIIFGILKYIFFASLIFDSLQSNFIHLNY